MSCLTYLLILIANLWNLKNILCTKGIVSMTNIFLSFLPVHTLYLKNFFSFLFFLFFLFFSSFFLPLLFFILPSFSFFFLFFSSSSLIALAWTPDVEHHGIYMYILHLPVSFSISEENLSLFHL